ncbi:hypothetical protein AB0001_004826 [Salmonella enterica]|nr:hypothetical protein [Salmonella enterica]EEP3373107.1 hypothetical protein [Salmonella enterica]EFP6579667.1 hypothetical protein [Salmonella enterica]EGC7971434.1 hypothetical protein [Salmonella enterica]EIV4461659.1 hypothetical protein [Salmonella enterica]
MNTNGKKIAVKTIALLAMVLLPELAIAAGVNKSDSGLNSLNTWLSTIVPIIAGMGGVVIFLLYMLGQIGKQIFQQMLTGLVGAGCISWVVSLFF